MHVQIVASPQQQGRRLQCFERGPHVGVQKQVENLPEIPRTTGQPLASGPPAPLWPVVRPTRREEVDDPAGPHGLLEAVDIPLQGRFRHPEGVVGGANVARKRAEQDKGAHPVGMGGGQQHGGQRRLGHREHRRTLAAHCVEHRDQTIGPRLHCGPVGDRHGIGAADPEQVGQDHSVERRQPVQVTGDGRLVPQQIDGKGRGQDEKEVGPIPDDLVGNVIFTVKRVPRFGGRRHVMSFSWWVSTGHCLAAGDNPAVNPQQQLIAQSLSDLSRFGDIAAVFRAGASSNEHRWELRSSSDELLAVTRRVHNGGRARQAFWKLVSATGMDAGNDMFMELLGAHDRVLARISSTNDAPAVVTVTDEAGHEVARSVREKTLLLKVKHPDRLTVHDADDRVCAQIECEQDSPWQLKNDAGQDLGELLAGKPGPSLSPRWYTWVDPKWALSDATYSRSQHLGLRRVTQYHAALDADVPRSPALSLLPLIAGLIY